MRSPRRLCCLLALTLVSPAGVLASPAHAPLDSTRVFELGAIDVDALRPRGTAVIEDQVGGTELRRTERLDYARALAAMPGLTVTNGGQRNEAGLYLRGFDLRQVSLFIDGIPMYVPYDGYVDLHRFTTFDVSRIAVSKGYSSVLYGPNALGGAINAISRRPLGALDVDAGLGTFSGSGVKYDLALGTRHAWWYAQATGSMLKQDDFPLPDGFRAVRVQPAGDRFNSDREDWRAGFKLGMTPRGTDEYALVLASQHGEKGNPPYTGHRAGVPVRYWRWPRWDKDNAYLITQTALPWGSTLKGRAYYDRFTNDLYAYDDSTYTTMKKRSSFKSFYDDPTVGASLEWALPVAGDHTLRTSVQSKFDRHQEHNLGEPQRKMDDFTMTYAGEDTWRAGGPFTAIAGASYSYRRALTIQSLQSNRVVSLPLGSDGAWNGQLAVVWDGAIGSVRGSIARRTRFATLKDRFSYRLGTAIPNPDLRPESAVHTELAYQGAPVAGWNARLSVFYSRIADLIQSVNNVAVLNGTAVSQMQNVGNARSAGFEVGIDGQPLRVLGVGVGYSFVDRRNLDAPAIKSVGAPRHGVTAYLESAPIPTLDLRASVAGYGERYATSDGVTLPPFATVDLRGALSLKPGIAIEGGVSNLLDAAYELDEGFPEAGRTFFTDVRVALTR